MIAVERAAIELNVMSVKDLYPQPECAILSGVDLARFYAGRPTVHFDSLGENKSGNEESTKDGGGEEMDAWLDVVQDLNRVAARVTALKAFNRHYYSFIMDIAI